MAWWKSQQDGHKVRAPSHQGWLTEAVWSSTAMLRGSNCLRTNSTFKENAAVPPASDTSSAHNWFLPRHFLWPGSASRSNPNSSASLPQPTVPGPPPTHLHTAYNNCQTSFPSVLTCLRLGPSEDPVRLLPRTDLFFALLPMPFLCFLASLGSLSFGKPVLLGSQASLSPLIWVPAVCQSFPSHWCF